MVWNEEETFEFVKDYEGFKCGQTINPNYNVENSCYNFKDGGKCPRFEKCLGAYKINPLSTKCIASLINNGILKKVDKYKYFLKKQRK